MEEDIVEEILKECKIQDKYFCEVLINVCVYYKIDKAKEISSLIEASEILKI